MDTVEINPRLDTLCPNQDGNVRVVIPNRAMAGSSAAISVVSRSLKDHDIAAFASIETVNEPLAPWIGRYLIV